MLIRCAVWSVLPLIVHECYLGLTGFIHLPYSTPVLPYMYLNYGGLQRISVYAKPTIRSSYGHDTRAEWHIMIYTLCLPRDAWKTTFGSARASKLDCRKGIISPLAISKWRSRLVLISLSLVSPSPGSPSDCVITSPDPDPGMHVAAVVGMLMVLALIVTLIVTILYYRRRKNAQSSR